MSRPITTEILDRPDLTASEKLLLVAIASHGAVAFPSQARLSRLTSLHARSIKRLIRSLRERGILTTQTGRKSLTYAIVGVGDIMSPTGTPCPPGGDTMSPVGVTPCHPNSKGNSQLNSPPNPQRGNGRAGMSRRERKAAEAAERADPNWVPF